MKGDLDLERPATGQWCQGEEVWRKKRPLHDVSIVICNGRKRMDDCGGWLHVLESGLRGFSRLQNCVKHTVATNRISCGRDMDSDAHTDSTLDC